MFADIVGHTALTSSDEDQGLKVRDELLRVARGEAGSHDGRVAKELGDGVLAGFRSARQALLAALSIQESFAVQPNAAKANARIRIGLHLADVTSHVCHADDFAGDVHHSVDLAPNSGQISSSGDVRKTVLLSVG